MTTKETFDSVCLMVADTKTWDETCSKFTNWIDKNFMPLIEKMQNDMDSFVEYIAEYGFYPDKKYITNIKFILENGTKSLAEQSAQHYYESLDEKSREIFKKNI